MHDTEQFVRVSKILGPVILRFHAERGMARFTSDELLEYCRQAVIKVAPESPGRIMRDLKEHKKLNYRVIDRSKGLYEFRPLDEPTPPDPQLDLLEDELW